MQTYKEEAQRFYQEWQRLQAELKTATAQHQKQSLKQKSEVAWLNYRNSTLHAELEETKANALGAALVEQSRWAEQEQEQAKAGLDDLSKTMERRLHDLAERLQKYRETGRYDNLAYAMLNEMPTIIGNSSPTSVAKYQADLARAQQVLELARPTDK